MKSFLSLGSIAALALCALLLASDHGRAAPSGSYDFARGMTATGDNGGGGGGSVRGGPTAGNPNTNYYSPGGNREIVNRRCRFVNGNNPRLGCYLIVQNARCAAFFAARCVVRVAGQVRVFGPCRICISN